MKTDNNWIETRILSDDISSLLGVPNKTTEDFLLTIENLVVSRLLTVLGDDDCKGKDYSIELPYLGTLVVSCSNKGNITTNFVCRPLFYRKIRKAVNCRVNPLEYQIGKVLGDYLVSKMEGDIESDE